ncbi:head-tail adaptor protein [Histidinibacterium aquaticum]|uniref:Head-tail adaptor protein n=1 Tax=Histidinibacterium aquaticum TaxID=2613962 RepID=A0A5J5GNB0_9RHOB|nr:head-tail adaptor protein [Histidinibacterium aquaticum]KAA9009034.1 head-tail adaptor protein [Histidinibacterium aquaticum]
MKRPLLTRRLVLEAPADTPDGAGGHAEGWTALGTLWAEVEVRSGGDRRGPAVPQSRLALRITLRAVAEGSLSRPQPGQRFREGARVYRLRAVGIADPFGRYLTCYAEEEVVA